MKRILRRLISGLMTSRRRSFLLATFLGALLIRLAGIAFVDHQQHILADLTNARMYEHGRIAHNLYTGHGFAMHWPYDSRDSVRTQMQEQPPRWEGAFLPPANPYLIFGFYSLFGENTRALLALMILYSLINALMPVAVYHVARLISSEEAARTSAIVSMLFLPAGYAVATFSGSAIYQVIAVVVLYFATRSVQTPSMRSFLGLGFWAGIMTQFRSEFFTFSFALIGLAAIVGYVSTRRTSTITQAIAAMLLCAVIVTPWTVRNYRLYHRFIPVLSHPWYEIWRGENDLATGTTFNDEGKSVWVGPEKYPQLIARMDSIPYDPLFEAKVDAIFHEDAIRFITTHPGRFLSLGCTKLAYFFTIDPNRKESANPGYWAPMLVVSMLTLLGFYRLLRDRSQRPAAVIFLAFFGYYMAGTFITLMLPRYQLYVFASIGALTGLAFYPSRSGKSSAALQTSA